MIDLNRKNFKLCFNIFCSLVVVGMVGYWIFKYGVEDRSIGVVDYVLLREAEDIKLPVASICFENPFSKKKFLGLKMNETSYLTYLTGDIEGDQFKDIDYQNVTINLGDYFELAYENWYNDLDYRETTLSFDHIVTFNGISSNSFLKCFSIDIHNKKYHYIKELILIYNKTNLINEWSGYDGIQSEYFYTLHYPGQFLHGYYMNYIHNFDHTLLSITIQEIEILKRRNRRKKKCIDDSTGYDKRILNHYASSKGCKLPYITQDEPFPVCRDAKILKENKFDYAKIRSLDYTPDCKIISKMAISDEYWSANLDILESNSSLGLQLEYPETIRIIHLSKEVDFHSLIGNIGGYLGLFLGYALIQIPDLVFFICDYIKSKFQHMTFSRSTIMPGIESTKLNIDSYQMPEGSSNQNGHLSETNSCRADPYGRNCCQNIGKKLVPIKYESSECFKDLESILTDANNRAQKEFNRHLENLKEEATKAIRMINHTKTRCNAFEFEK